MEKIARLAALNSWKEIADYLDRSVRTVQRWEARFSLPVRHRSGKRTAVFAIQAELDAWLQTRSSFRGELHDNFKAYEVIFHRLPTPLALVNDAREFVDVNTALYHLVRREAKDLKGLPLDEFFIETERGSLPVAWEAMLSRGSVSNSLLLRVPGAGLRWIELHGTARIVPGLHLIVLRGL